MKNSELAEKRLLYLLDVVGKYNATNRSIDVNGNCVYYNGKYKMGCAIGDAIEDKQLCQWLDNPRNGLNGTGVNNIFKHLPDNLKQLGKDFLIEVQNLHDCEDYWDLKGLCEEGVEEAESIFQNYIEKDLVIEK